MKDTPEQQPHQLPTIERSGETTESHALLEVMHGVILGTVLIVSSYLIGVTYWAVSYGTL